VVELLRGFFLLAVNGSDAGAAQVGLQALSNAFFKVHEELPWKKRVVLLLFVNAVPTLLSLFCLYQDAVTSASPAQQAVA
jgi:hypothetical protein